MFVKPIVQAVALQPNEKQTGHTIVSLSVSPNSKPIAKVCPIDKRPVYNNKSIQTDEIISDIDKIISLEDYQRSLRSVGRANSDLYPVNDFKDVKKLSAELKEQRKINQELKKLLVASLGNDLAEMFTKLNCDLNQLNSKVEELLTERMTMRESADDFAIEADVWRHKFLAGRAVLDELDKWKQQLEIQHNEAVKAVLSLLNERNELRLILSKSNSVLFNMFQDFPLNLQTNSDYIDTLSLANRTLSLANSLALSVGKARSVNQNNRIDRVTNLTLGEEAAIKALSNQQLRTTFPTGRAISSLKSSSSTDLEKMSLHICRNCKGDVFVV